MVNRIAKDLKNKFLQIFGDNPLIVKSPGRVNIIGEHTDYNDGFVLPAAIDKAAYFAISSRNDDEIHLYAHTFDEHFSTTTKNIQPHPGWPTYILGVVDQLQRKGISIGGFNMAFDSDIPIGAGLSSSAALECGALYALHCQFQFPMEKLEMVKAAQMAEHQFAGVRCGIMDQFASMFGAKGYVIKLNCKTLAYEYVPLNLQGVRIVLFNTNVRHSLSSSEYNVRREQCEQGVQWIKERHPLVQSLSDANIQMLHECVLPKDELIYKRCLYVVQENMRLQQACAHLKNGNIAALGEAMFRTHKGLSEEYEVSCRELDFLVNYVQTNQAVLGARMMGGGFGGCTINLIKEEAIERLAEKISQDYRRATGLELSTYITQIENGTSVIKEGNRVELSDQ